jgi:FkbM family methyltransferase
LEKIMMDPLLNTIQRLAKGVSERLGRDSWIIRKTRPLYEATLAAVAPSAAVPWDINGESFRIDPRYRHYFGHDYERSVASFLKSHVKPGDICFDVGANVGVYVLQLARVVSPSGKVVAFEPDPTAREIMERHVQLNGYSARLITVPTAVADQSGERNFYFADAAGTSRLDEPNKRWMPSAASKSVRVTTIDEFVESTGLEPRWILMDIEGHELQALLGARRLIERRRGRLGFVIEMHPGAWPGVDDNSDVDRLLSELKLRCDALTGQHHPLAEYGHVHLF